MSDRNFRGILQAENGNEAPIELPITDKKFKALLGGLTDGNLALPWGIRGLSVSHPLEAAALTQAKSLSEINYYCAVVKNLTTEENVLFTTLLDAGFCREGNLDDLINHALNVGNFVFYPGIPDAYALGKKILETNVDEDGKPPENFNSESKIIWLGEYISTQNDGRFCNGCYIDVNENYRLLYDGPADIPDIFRIPVPLWDNETE